MYLLLFRLHYPLYLENVNLAASTVDFILPIVSVYFLFCHHQDTFHPKEPCSLTTDESKSGGRESNRNHNTQRVREQKRAKERVRIVNIIREH